MVVFTCDGCGETLKKSQVDAHVYRCRNGCESVSCVDCSVSFYGDDYKLHTSCISEAERYEKTVYKGRAKKKNPQEAWMESIGDAVTIAPPEIRSLVQGLLEYDNVPRKEKAFKNFCRNSMKGANLRTVSSVWEYLVDIREKQKAAVSASAGSFSEEAKPHNTVFKSSQANVSIPSVSAIPSTQTPLPDVSGKRMKKTMTKMLKRAPDRTMRFKELKKRIRTKLDISKIRDNEIKLLMTKCIECEKKITLDGKYVKLQSTFSVT